MIEHKCHKLPVMHLMFPLLFITLIFSYAYPETWHLRWRHIKLWYDDVITKAVAWRYAQIAFVLMYIRVSFESDDSVLKNILGKLHHIVNGPYKIEPPGVEETKSCSNGSDLISVTTAMPMFGKKVLKISSSRSNWPIAFKSSSYNRVPKWH